MLEGAPLITIITPVWNGLPFLQEAAHSVLNQTCRRFDWIISDDGSTDGSRDYLLGLKSSARVHIRVYFQVHNLGIFGNLNFLCEQVSSELILILCQDDFFTSSETVALALANWRCLDHSVAAARWNSRDHPVAKLANPLHPTQSQLAFFLHGCIPGNLSNVSFRKSAWSQVGPFDQGYPFAGDFYYWAKLCSRFSLAFFPDQAVFVRSHLAQASNHLNRKGELYVQLSRISSEIYGRITPGGPVSRLVLRIAGTLVYHAQYVRVLARQPVSVQVKLMRVFLASDNDKTYLLSALPRWFLFAATLGGLIGKNLILSIAWLLNNPTEKE